MSAGSVGHCSRDSAFLKNWRGDGRLKAAAGIARLR